MKVLDALLKRPARAGACLCVSHFGLLTRPFHFFMSKIGFDLININAFKEVVMAALRSDRLKYKYCVFIYQISS